MAGRPEIVDEVAASQADVRHWVARRTGEFLATNLADYAIAGALSDAHLVPRIVDRVRERMESIAQDSQVDTS